MQEGTFAVGRGAGGELRDQPGGVAASPRFRSRADGADLAPPGWTQPLSGHGHEGVTVADAEVGAEFVRAGAERAGRGAAYQLEYLGHVVGAAFDDASGGVGTGWGRGVGGGGGEAGCGESGCGAHLDAVQ